MGRPSLKLSWYAGESINDEIAKPRPIGGSVHRDDRHHRPAAGKEGTVYSPLSGFCLEQRPRARLAPGEQCSGKIADEEKSPWAIPGVFVEPTPVRVKQCVSFPSGVRT